MLYDIPSCHVLNDWITDVSNAEEDRFCDCTNGTEVVGEREHRPSIIDRAEVGILGVGEDASDNKLSSEGDISTSLICESSSLIIR